MSFDSLDQGMCSLSQERSMLENVIRKRVENDRRGELRTPMKWNEKRDNDKEQRLLWNT